MSCVLVCSQDREVGCINDAHETMVWSLAWHPMGHILVSGSNDHSRYIELAVTQFCVTRQSLDHVFCTSALCVPADIMYVCVSGIACYECLIAVSSGRAIGPVTACGIDTTSTCCPWASPRTCSNTVRTVGIVSCVFLPLMKIVHERKKYT